MSIQQLPNELLLFIFEYAYPIGFESLLLSCKQLYAIGKHRFVEYNKCRNRYRNLILREPYDLGDVLNIHNAVLGLIYRPDVACFIRSLHIVREGDFRSGEPPAVLRDIRADFPPHPPGRTREHSLTDNTVEYITRSPWLKLAGCDTAKWAYRMTQLRCSQYFSSPSCRDKPEYAMLYALLLMQLTNLEWLTITYDSAILRESDILQQCYHRRGPGCLSDEDRALAREAGRVLCLMSAHVGSNSGVSGLISPLEHLRELHFNKKPEMDEVEDLTRLNVFITSPNMRRLHATNIVSVSGEDSDNSFMYTWPGPFPTLFESKRDSFSGLVHLELVQCCMDGYGVAAMLRHMPHVTTFRYTHSDKADCIQMDWDAGLFLQGLADPWAVYRGSSQDDGREQVVKRGQPTGLAGRITDLSIGVEQLSGEIITRVSDTTLRQFTALQHLAIDVLVFMGPDASTGERHGSFESCGLGGEGICEWDASRPGALPGLIDMLPPGIEDLELYLDNNDEMARVKHWDRLLPREPLRAKFPQLEQIRIIEKRPREPPPQHVAVQEQIAQVAAISGAEYCTGQFLTWRSQFRDVEQVTADLASLGYN